MNVRIRFDGEELIGRSGQTIAGVLLGAGRRSWRTGAGAERGIFCGIGICRECIVTVNSIEGVRACLRAACDGDIVEREMR
jgi:hypothetical protein